MIPPQDGGVSPRLIGNVEDLYRHKLEFLPEVCADGERSITINPHRYSDTSLRSLNTITGSTAVEPRPKLVHVTPRGSHTNATEEADTVLRSSEFDRSHSNAHIRGENNPVNYSSDATIDSSSQEGKPRAKPEKPVGFFKRRGSRKSKRRKSARRSSMCNDNSKTRSKISVGSKLKAKFFSSGEKHHAIKDSQGSPGGSTPPPRSTPDSAKSPVIRNINKVVRFPRVSRSYSLDGRRSSAYTHRKETLASFTEEPSAHVADQNTPHNRQTDDSLGPQPSLSPRKASEGVGKSSDYEVFASSITLSQRRPLQKLKSQSTHGLQSEACKARKESWDRTQSQHSLFKSNETLTNSNQSLLQSTRSLAFSNQSLGSARTEKRVTQKGSVVSVTRHESLKRQRHSTYPHNVDRRKASGGSLKLISSTGSVLKNTATAKSVEVLSSHKGRQLSKNKSTTKLDLEKLQEDERERKRTQREEDRRMKEIQNRRKQQQRLEIYALNKIMTEFENSNFQRFMESKSSNVSSLPV